MVEPHTGNLCSAFVRWENVNRGEITVKSDEKALATSKISKSA